MPKLNPISPDGVSIDSFGNVVDVLMKEGIISVSDINVVNELIADLTRCNGSAEAIKASLLKTAGGFFSEDAIVKRIEMVAKKQPLVSMAIPLVKQLANSARG
jgi:hypothetical protein